MGVVRMGGALALLSMAAVAGLGACSAAHTTAGAAAAVGSKAGTACAPKNVTQPCSCADQANAFGRQVCTNGKWLACQCAALTSTGPGNSADSGSTTTVDGGTVVTTTLSDGGPLSDGNSSAVRFDWSRTTCLCGSCEAGHYIGIFTGFFAPPAAFGGPVDVASVDSPTGDGGAIQPGFELWLNHRPGSEILDISGGAVRGTDDAGSPFGIVLKGSLDCSTGKFTGQLLQGWYDASGTRFHFEGTVTDDYNKITHQFIGGKWTVAEPKVDGGVPPLSFGGSGDWIADLKHY